METKAGGQCVCAMVAEGSGGFLTVSAVGAGQCTHQNPEHQKCSDGSTADSTDTRQRRPALSRSSSQPRRGYAQEQTGECEAHRHESHNESPEAEPKYAAAADGLRHRSKPQKEVRREMEGWAAVRAGPHACRAHGQAAPPTCVRRQQGGSTNTARNTAAARQGGGGVGRGRSE